MKDFLLLKSYFNELFLYKTPFHPILTSNLKHKVSNDAEGNSYLVAKRFSLPHHFLQDSVLNYPYEGII